MARVSISASSAAPMPSPLVLKLEGGRAPFRWLANGSAAVGRRAPSHRDLDARRRRHIDADGDRDAAGRAASVVFVE